MTNLDSSPLRIASVQLDLIPNRITQQQRFWVPEEPLFGPDPLNDTIKTPNASIGQLAENHPQFQFTRRLLEQEYIEAARLRLLRILEFCKLKSVHLVVFPEYSIPPSLLSILIGYSSEMVIVAGIGLMRQTDIDRLSNLNLSRIKPSNNCAVITAPGIIEFVTKKYPSEGEYMEFGEGPRILEINLNKRIIRLGVAICMDYIHIGHTFGNEGTHLDVVAIPALSKTTDVFIPDQPRDFVRVISNHSHYGGSQVIIPRPSGVAFVNDMGTIPISIHEEGIVVVDFDKFQSAPKSTFSSRNKLIFKGSILCSPTEIETHIVEKLNELPTELSLSSEALQMVDAWIEKTKDIPRLITLNSSLQIYKRLASSDLIGRDDLSLLITHLLVPDAKISNELRIAQCKEVSATLRNIVSEDSPSSIYNAQSEYAGLMTILKPTRKHHGVEIPINLLRNTYFALGLGSYDSDEARRTTIYQLDLLRAFGMSFDESFTLNYRLTTHEIAETQDKGSYFEIILGGKKSKDLIQDQSEQFERAYRAIFLSGYSCYSSNAEIDASESHVYLIEPEDNTNHAAPAVRSDWGGVVDILRAQPKAIILDLLCSPLNETLHNRPIPISTIPTSNLTLSTHVIQGIGSEEFIDFLNARSIENGLDPATLELKVKLSCSHKISESLLYTIGAMLLGHDRFKVISLVVEGMPVPHTSEIYGFKLRADEALRIFHPPHGHIEGRGLEDRKKLKLLAQSVPLTQSGCVLGRAVAARAYVDTSFDLAMDEESRLRHVYVIGKTGSGKTNLLKNLVRQDILNGMGVVVVDPHGDLAEYALGHCGARINDCLYLDFADINNLPVLNPLSLDINNSGQKLIAIEELLEILTRRTYHEWYGPRFENTVRLALDMLEIQSPEIPCSILDVPGILRNKSKRQEIIRTIESNSELKSRWDIFSDMRDTEQAEVLNWVLAKFDELEQSEVLKKVLAAGQSTLSIIDVIKEKKILIVRVPESIIGTRTASFLGSLIVARISRHIVEINSNFKFADTKPIFMYVDEFQKFVGSGFETLIPEARKFGLGLVLAHQNTDQLRAFSRFEGSRDSSVLTQILGNVGSIICFRIGSRDAELIGSELRIELNKLMRIGRYEAVARVVSNGSETDPVTISVYDSSAEPGLPETRERIRRILRDSGVLI